MPDCSDCCVTWFDQSERNLALSFPGRRSCAEARAASRYIRRLFEKDEASGIRPDLHDKVRTILAQLGESATIDAMSLTAFMERK